jgi:hypothetical protein
LTLKKIELSTKLLVDLPEVLLPGAEIELCVLARDHGAGVLTDVEVAGELELGVSADEL